MVLVTIRQSSTPVGRTYRTADFDYEYPPDAVAQHPLPDRSASRLLVLDRTSDTIHHRGFGEFPTLLESGDVLVLNTSRVIPARLKGIRENGREAEVLLVHPEPNGQWLAMVHPGGKLKVGRTIRFGDEGVAQVVGVLGGGLRRLEFSGTLDVSTLMRRHGSVPLPPYIARSPEPSDRERYQTVYADADGSIAAPTAGLHFTAALLDLISQRGIEIVETMLHVGPGTFKPIETDDPTQHTMHAEWYSVSEAAADHVNAAKARGKRVWAVGTTVARTLETVADNEGVRAGSGWTELFICPPYRFRVVDAMLTNFHLPRSTLLMLVAAFAGYERAMAAYREALRERYRLFSYGDAMAIT
jgi:S-adenosylmethionine:tRNA ribosyltransferase-isomerase